MTLTMNNNSLLIDTLIFVEIEAFFRNKHRVVNYQNCQRSYFWKCWYIPLAYFNIKKRKKKNWWF